MSVPAISCECCNQPPIAGPIMLAQYKFVVVLRDDGESDGAWLARAYRLLAADSYSAREDLFGGAIITHEGEDWNIFASPIWRNTEGELSFYGGGELAHIGHENDLGMVLWECRYKWLFQPTAWCYYKFKWEEVTGKHIDDADSFDYPGVKEYTWTGDGLTPICIQSGFNLSDYSKYPFDDNGGAFYTVPIPVMTEAEMFHSAALGQSFKDIYIFHPTWTDKPGVDPPAPSDLVSDPDGQPYAAYP